MNLLGLYSGSFYKQRVVEQLGVAEVRAQFDTLC